MNGTFKTLFISTGGFTAMFTDLDLILKVVIGGLTATYIFIKILNEIKK